MRILLFAHPSAWHASLSLQTRAHAWLHEYRSAWAALLGESQVALFDPYSTRLDSLDRVHIFSCEEPETWHWVRSKAGFVAVSPWVPLPDSQMTVPHEEKNKSNEAAFYSTPDAFFVLPAWQNALPAVLRERVEPARLHPVLSESAQLSVDRVRMVLS